MPTNRCALLRGKLEAVRDLVRTLEDAYERFSTGGHKEDHRTGEQAGRKFFQEYPEVVEQYKEYVRGMVMDLLLPQIVAGPLEIKFLQNLHVEVDGYFDINDAVSHFPRIIEKISGIADIRGTRHIDLPYLREAGILYVRGRLKKLSGLESAQVVDLETGSVEELPNLKYLSGENRLPSVSTAGIALVLNNVFKAAPLLEYCRGDIDFTPVHMNVRSITDTFPAMKTIEGDVILDRRTQSRLVRQINRLWLPQQGQKILKGRIKERY